LGEEEKGSAVWGSKIPAGEGLRLWFFERDRFRFRFFVFFSNIQNCPPL
jgi:hypothetical protein